MRNGIETEAHHAEEAAVAVSRILRLNLTVSMHPQTAGCVSACVFPDVNELMQQ